MYKQWFKLFISIYWRAIFMVIWPFAISPILIIYFNDSAFRCAYVLLLMAGYWVSECIPMAITGFIPIVLFPMLGILDTYDTCAPYMKSANVIFIGGLMMALSIEYSGLNIRIALNWILLMGTSHRRLHLALSIITMFISMWIVNTAATAMMLPIIEACLRELESNGLGEMYTYPPDAGQMTDVEKEEVKKPSNITMSYYLTAAYASSIGGCGTLVGTGTNLTLKGLYEGDYPGHELDFVRFSAFNIPPMLVSTVFTWLWLEFIFMGLFRPKSNEGILVAKAKDNEQITRNVIKQKAEALGRMTFHEIMTTVLFIIAVLMFVFRKLDVIPGWSLIFPKPDYIKDAVTACFICILYFFIPASPTFIHTCDEDESKRPKRASKGILSWTVVHAKLAWGMIFLLGSGFALAEGMKSSGLSKLLGGKVGSVAKQVPPLVSQIVISFFTGMFTELTANVAVANIMVPISSEVCRNLNWHPLYLMLPTGMAASFAFMLPVGTPPNALVAPACNMPIGKMMMVGFIVKIICLTSLLSFWQILGPTIFHSNEPLKLTRRAVTPMMDNA